MAPIVREERIDPVPIHNLRGGEGGCEGGIFSRAAGEDTQNWGLVRPGSNVEIALYTCGLLDTAGLAG